ncbi:MAG: hybrid sensor histidine kinase/response regulator [Methanomicrobiales archaeon]|nr:hybrid sensor histidine kinase/response regulator [Methanomicrobiales archaeon]
MSDPVWGFGSALIVEDSRTQAEFLGHILESAGIPYEIAENGLAALALVAKNGFGIILTDIVMEGMDGYELCRHIRTNALTKDIPVIMVTQLFDVADILKGLEAGANNFIIKPFDEESVLTRIAEALEEENHIDAGCTNTPLTVEFFNQPYTIRAGRRRILQILVSTYALAIRKNAELLEAQERLQALNDQLHLTVNELKEANNDLIKENLARKTVESSLEQVNKKLQLMTSITRHDLLNHLTVLQGYLEISQMPGTDPAKIAGYLTRSIGVVQKSIDTIQFTSEYQKIEITAPAWHPVSALIERSLRHASCGAVRVINDIPDTAHVLADPLIEKVIYNLIDNALRYGETLTTIRFSLESEDDLHIIVCEDDGVGVPEDQKERIFHYGVGQHTGMGLFLVREILAITSITIRENGVPGRGARFELIIPPASFRS